MISPDQQLTDLICAVLKDRKILNDASVDSLKQKIASGKIKPEDWSLAVENTLEANDRDGAHE